MTFIRTKLIKGKKYAYLVENKWKGGRSKQRVRQYLGKVINPDKNKDLGFESHLESIKNMDLDMYIEKSSRADMVRDLVHWELTRHGVDIKNIRLDLKKKKLKIEDNENIVLEINEGHMCGNTVGSILTINPDCDREVLAYKLARAFVDAGIEIPKDLFVAFFAKTNYQNRVIK